jgi:hypothetical protein
VSLESSGGEALNLSIAKASRKSTIPKLEDFQMQSLFLLMRYA